jgi:hypothetical protein
VHFFLPELFFCGRIFFSGPIWFFPESMYESNPIILESMYESNPIFVTGDFLDFFSFTEIFPSVFLESDHIFFLPVVFFLSVVNNFCRNVLGVEKIRLFWIRIYSEYKS